MKRLFCYCMGLISLLGFIGATQAWANWQMRAPLPMGVSRAGGATADGMIFVLGGENGNGLTDQVFMYDPMMDTWEQRPPLSTPVFIPADVSQGTMIYIVGGGTPMGISNEVLAYDALTGDCTVAGTLEVPRGWTDAAIVDNKIYIAGGWGTPSAGMPGVLDSIEEFDLVTGQSRIVGRLLEGRELTGVAASGGMIYIMGGYSAEGLPRGNCWEFDPMSGSITPRSPMLFPLAIGEALVQDNGRILLVGGATSPGRPPTEFTNAIQEYDPVADEWRIVAFYPTPRYAHTAEIAYNTLFVIGGDEGGMMPLSVNEALDLSFSDNPDITPPTVPTDLTTTIMTCSDIDLTWGTSMDDFGVAGYAIYRDGVFVGTSMMPDFLDSALAGDATHCYTVDAFDAAGNHSLPSGPACATLNCSDLCPNDPIKTEPGICGCGAADLDSDMDGTPDCLDDCPNDAGKTGPGMCGCGAADADSDSDGTPDCVDLCPNDPADDCVLCKLEMVWYQADGSLLRRDPSCNDDGSNCYNCGGYCYDIAADACLSYRCVTGTEIKPSCQSLTDCQSSCAGECLRISTAVPNCADNCPDDPTKIEPGICGCGVSDTDSDSDGTADCLDPCPNDPTSQCSGCMLEMVWYNSAGERIRRDPNCNSDLSTCFNCGGFCYDLSTDACTGYRCVTGNEITPNCFSLTDCQASCAGECVLIAPASPDCTDNCPNDPAKLNPGVCGCGVPDRDSDGDGAVDCVDICPNDRAKTSPGICGCGVADKDSDSDGAADCVDPCPVDATDRCLLCSLEMVWYDSAGVEIRRDPNCSSDGSSCFNCGGYCYDMGADTCSGYRCVVGHEISPSCYSLSDCQAACAGECVQIASATPDCGDFCPDDPAKVVPGMCGCGVPDTDSDRDGTADCVDLCPGDPTKTDPGMCGCGALDADTDNDGTADCTDPCPNDPVDACLLCKLEMVWYRADGTLSRRDPNCNDDGSRCYNCGGHCYDVTTDGCGSYRCVVGNEINPSCSNLADCQRACAGECLHMAYADPVCNDNCPDDPTKIDPGICGCGVPDTDSDNDGRADCLDPCPNDPTSQCTACTLEMVWFRSDGTESRRDPNCNSDNFPCTDCSGFCYQIITDACPGYRCVFGNDITPGCYNLTDCQAACAGECVHIPSGASACPGSDLCPYDPVKTDPGICGCGVADTDSDMDGTADCVDNCPNDAAKIDPGICGCGVADADIDNDGAVDCVDNCPNDAAKTDPGACGCGVPDVDTDNDGMPDCLETCPNNAIKTAPGICGCDVADTDADSDGTADCLDRCPNDAAKIEPGICGCGVVEVDSDGDGVSACAGDCDDNNPAVRPGGTEICGNSLDEDCDGIAPFCTIHDVSVASLRLPKKVRACSTRPRKVRAEVSNQGEFTEMIRVQLTIDGVPMDQTVYLDPGSVARVSFDLPSALLAGPSANICVQASIGGQDLSLNDNKACGSVRVMDCL